MSGFRNQSVVRIYGSSIVYSSIVLVNYLCSYVVISVGLLNMICCIGQIKKYRQCEIEMMQI